MPQPISEFLSMSLSEIQRGLGRVEGKLDQVMVGQGAHEESDQTRFTEIDKRFDEFDNRQRAVEKKLYIWAGAVAVIAFAIAHFPFSLILKG